MPRKKEIINKVGDNSSFDYKYFDIKNKILKHKKIVNIISTATGYGKTTSFGNWVYETVWNSDDKVFVWIRRSEVEIRKSVVPLFKTLFLGNKETDKKARVSINGVEIDGIPRVYFIPLNLYYNYKSLTNIDNVLQAIIWDEAIHCNESKQFINEQYNYSQLINILCRDKEIPVFFLCNPYKKGIWFWEMFANDIIPSGEKEQIKIRDKALVFTAPLKKERKKRGTIELFESEETKRLTVGGQHREQEENFIKLENPYENEDFRLLVSFVYCQKLLNFYKNDKNGYFLLSESMDKNIESKKIVSFTYNDYNKFPSSILYHWREFADFFSNLLHSKKLFFNNYSIRDSFVMSYNRLVVSSNTISY